jgi:hypothetical protein
VKKLQIKFFLLMIFIILKIQQLYKVDRLHPNSINFAAATNSSSAPAATAA